MKTRYVTAIFFAVSLLASAHAQTGKGFPKLPPVPKTGPLTDDPASTHFTFIAVGDNRPAGRSSSLSQ